MPTGSLLRADMIFSSAESKASRTSSSSRPRCTHSTTAYAQGSFTIGHGQAKKVSLKVARRWRGKRSIDTRLVVKATPLLWASPLTLGAVTITSASA